MTDQEITKAKKVIDAMTQFEMARLWRFAPSGHPYFGPELGPYFKEKFQEKGFFNSQISKALGWGT